VVRELNFETFSKGRKVLFAEATGFFYRIYKGKETSGERAIEVPCEAAVFLTP
jgi:hypothetical protein